jgi:hypothetical protein
VFLHITFCGNFLDAATHEEGPQMSKDSLRFNKWLKNDMGLEIILFKYNDLRELFNEKESDIKRYKQ